MTSPQMRRGKSYRIKFPDGKYRLAECLRVIDTDEKLSPADVTSFYGVPRKKKALLRSYMKPLRSCVRYVFQAPSGHKGIGGSKFVVMVDFCVQIKKEKR